MSARNMATARRCTCPRHTYSSWAEINPRSVSRSMVVSPLHLRLVALSFSPQLSKNRQMPEVLPRARDRSVPVQVLTTPPGVANGSLGDISPFAPRLARRGLRQSFTRSNDRVATLGLSHP